MKTLSVQVQGDHLEALTRTRSPVDAIAELIWNSLDADATDVRVHLDRNPVGGLKAVRVSDNGLGLRYEEALSTFEKLGGSWKRGTGRTRGEGRLLHGKHGRGRFRAFGLGDTVEWRTRYALNGGMSTYTIIGRRSNLATFEVGDITPSSSASSGTDVEVTNLSKDFASLCRSSAVGTLAEQLALYLRQYPRVAVIYDGNRIDPAAVESCVTDYDFHVRLGDDREVAAALTVIEWRTQGRRALFLCDAAGFALHEMPPGIQAPRFSFTAYLKSDHMRELEAEGAFMLEELHPDLKKLLDRAKDELRRHFRHRAAGAATALVDEWKTQNIYPYQGDPRDVIEEVERQVFDVVALNVNDYLPDFEQTGLQGKRLAFGLLREAIGSSPTALQRILRDVLDLPEAKRQELATLLQKTSLEAIINASKLVADRLDFLAGIEILLFNEPGKSALLERRQLHRILAEHTWIFGEEFNLTVDDRSLAEVLKAHLQLLGRQPDVQEPVLQEDGVKGIPDLMLSRVVPQPRADEREHLVVELKRPKVSISLEALNQVSRYSTAVAEDERFRDTKTRWVFWALSNQVDDAVRRQARQKNRPEGLFYEDEEQRISIWVKTWGQIIQECRGRLRFFQEHLRYAADDESALAYLRDAHAKYLPKALLSDTPSSSA